MSTQEQANAYARAVYESALESWVRELAKARVAFEQSDAAQQLNRHEQATERLKAVDIITARAPKEVKNFLSALAEKGHLHLLGDVIRDLEHMSRQGPQPRIARITSATKLTEPEQKALRATVQERFGGDVECDFVVDPAIIGGVIIQIGDQVIDGSIATRLTQMKSTLLGAR